MNPLGNTYVSKFHLIYMKVQQRQLAAEVLQDALVAGAFESIFGVREDIVEIHLSLDVEYPKVVSSSR